MLQVIEHICGRPRLTALRSRVGRFLSCSHWAFCGRGKSSDLLWSSSLTAAEVQLVQGKSRVSEAGLLMR